MFFFLWDCFYNGRKEKTPASAHNVLQDFAFLFFLLIFAAWKEYGIFWSHRSKMNNQPIDNMRQDIRWLQRYGNYHRACRRILDVTESGGSPADLSELEMEGLIQRFEYTFELGWKVLQDLLKYKGYEFMQGPNGTLRKAFEDGLIADHDGWRRMAMARVTTSHTYNEGEAAEVVRQIYHVFAPLLKGLDRVLAGEKARMEEYGGKGGVL